MQAGSARRPFNNTGVYGDEVPPVLIPNTEVKLISADGTWLDTARESMTMPVPKRRAHSNVCSFFLQTTIVMSPAHRAVSCPHPRALKRRAKGRGVVDDETIARHNASAKGARLYSHYAFSKTEFTRRSAKLSQAAKPPLESRGALFECRATPYNRVDTGINLRVPNSSPHAGISAGSARRSK